MCGPRSAAPTSSVARVVDVTIFNVPLDELRRRNSIKWARFEPDVLPMFVAEMDCHLAAPISERLQRAIAESDTGYPEKPLYQEAFIDFADWMWDWRIDAELMSLAGDVMQGIRELVLAVTDPGDSIVVNTPVYPPIRNTCRMTGREMVDVPVTAQGRLDLDALEAAFTEQRPSAYLLCSPHNPHGTLHTREELEQVAQLADRHDVTVISDEIHAPLAGPAHVPFTSVAGAQDAFVVTSASKSWNLAGMKAAVIIGGNGTRDVLRRLPSIVAESASWFGILAHSTALAEARDWLQQATREISANKQFLARQLRERLDLDHEPSEATYLAWIDCATLGLDNPAQHFHDVGRVRFNFGTDFDPSAGQHVRFNAATSQAIIADGVGRMAASLGR